MTRESEIGGSHGHMILLSKIFKKKIWYNLFPADKDSRILSIFSLPNREASIADETARRKRQRYREREQERNWVREKERREEERRWLSMGARRKLLASSAGRPQVRAYPTE